MERGDVQRPHPIGPFLKMEDPTPGARKTNMLVVLLGAVGSHTAGDALDVALLIAARATVPVTLPSAARERRRG